MLYDIRHGRWSSTMCEMLGIPMSMLPEVKDCAADFGMARSDLFDFRVHRASVDRFIGCLLWCLNGSMVIAYLLLIMCISNVRLRIGLKLPGTTVTAKVVHMPIMFQMFSSLVRIDCHAANRIDTRCRLIVYLHGIP